MYVVQTSVTLRLLLSAARVDGNSHTSDGFDPEGSSKPAFDSPGRRWSTRSKFYQLTTEWSLWNYKFLLAQDV